MHKPFIVGMDTIDLGYNCKYFNKTCFLVRVESITVYSTTCFTHHGEQKAWEGFALSPRPVTLLV